MFFFKHGYFEVCQTSRIFRGVVQFNSLSSNGAVASNVFQALPLGP